jgi:hypothetical protein
MSSTIVSTRQPMIRLATAAYLARFKSQSRVHTESDLCGYLESCQQRDLDPLVATRPHLELYLGRHREVRRFKPSTVSRADVGSDRLPPDLCHRRSPRALAGRVPPGSHRASRVSRCWVSLGC